MSTQVTFRFIVPVLILWASSLSAGLELQQPSGTDFKSQVTSFHAEGISALQALLRLAELTTTPIGIAQDDTSLSTTKVKISSDDAPAPEILDRILQQVRGYRWQYSKGDAVILIVPISPRAVTNGLLSLPISHFAPPEMGIQGLNIWLWMFIRASLDPTLGTGGSILQNPNDPMFQIDERDTTVEDILNKIVYLSKGAWVLSPLPSDLVDPNGPSPFTITANR